MASPPPPAGSETSEGVDGLAERFRRCEAIGACHAVVIVTGLR